MAEKSLKINAFYSVLRAFLSLIFPLITFPYASRILLPEGIGKVNFASTVISYFVMFANLGIGGYATREASKVKDNKFALTKLFKEIITINLVCCFFAYILFFLAINTIPKLYPYRELLLVCCIRILISVLETDWLFTASEDFKYITIRSFFIQIFSLLYLFLFVKTSEDIIHYAIFGMITSVGCNLINFFTIGKYVDLHIHNELNFRRHIKPILVFFSITIVTSIYTTLDTAMLGFLSNDEQVGFYTASSKLGHMILSMLTALTAVLLPRLTSVIKKNDYEEFKTLVNKSSNILLLLSIPMTAGIMLLCKPLVFLLSGENYLPAIPAMLIISPIIIFISFGSFTGVQILPSLGKEKISFISYIFGSIMNITMNVLLIPKNGAIGAAIGSVFAEFTVTLIQTIYLRKLLFNKSFFKTLLQASFASLIMAVFVIILKFIVHNIILQLAVCTLIGIIVYSLVLVLLKNECFIFYMNKFKTFIKKYLCKG